MPESLSRLPAETRSSMQGLPTLLDCLRIELEAARARGRKPIKLLVHGDCSLALCDTARAEGELDASASPARILDLPLMMSMELISAAEGGRIVCEGDDLHTKMVKRREALIAGRPL